MSERLSGEELVALVQRVFEPVPGEKVLGIMIDLPDAKVGDDAAWAERREIGRQWVEALQAHQAELGMEARLVMYRNAHTNNGDLPATAWIHAGGPLPATAEAAEGLPAVPMTEVFDTYPILIAVTKFSSTAPLKMAAKKHPMRAATMPGFRPSMVPSLRLDYQEVNRRVNLLKDLLDRATGADFRFLSPAGEDTLHLDLRHRTGHASGGLIPKLGTAGNLPSGEAYIVPYEGEVAGDPSRTEGILPVQFEGEVVRYRITANKALEVISQGPESEREAALLKAEPAYGNLSELGLGVLAAFGVKPIGVVLLDEKLGLHIAFGRSEHFGGQVGPDAFSSPDAVVHIDRVYVPETQPDVKVLSADLRMADGSVLPLIRDWDYAIDFNQ